MYSSHRAFLYGHGIRGDVSWGSPTLWLWVALSPVGPRHAQKYLELSISCQLLYHHGAEARTLAVGYAVVVHTGKSLDLQDDHSLQLLRPAILPTPVAPRMLHPRKWRNFTGLRQRAEIIEVGIWRWNEWGGSQRKTNTISRIWRAGGTVSLGEGD
jgi:hypothetical protein